MNDILRNKINELNEIISTNKNESNVILVEGPRQVGKTTVIRQWLEKSKSDYVEINLEKNRRHALAINQCEDFEQFTEWLKDTFRFNPNGKQVLFIDEAQESKQLGSFVRFMKEDWKNTLSILTGSMMSRLFREGVRYPVGRVHTLAIQPFSFSEFLLAKQHDELAKLVQEKKISHISPNRHHLLIEELNYYLQIGGLPKVALAHAHHHDPDKILAEILANYRQDFIRVFGEEQGYLFDRCLQAVADHVGSPSKLTQAILANEPGYRKLEAVYARIEAWRMIYLSNQRSAQPEGSTTLHPKRYLFDMGILAKLRSTAIPPLDLLKTQEATHRTVLGGILENFVAFHLLSWQTQVQGWKRDSAGIEIDFIIKTTQGVFPIECKASFKSKETHLKALKAYMQEYKIKLGFLVNLAKFEIKKYPFGEIIVIPAYAIEALPRFL